MIMDTVEPQSADAALATHDYSLAVELARRLHEEVTFAHVKRVTARIKAELSIGGPDPVFAHRALIVAMIHDAVEDSPLSVDTVAALFSKEIAEAVDAISRRKKAGEVYDEYIDRAKRNPIARIVKLADIEDHLDPALAATLRPDLKERYLKAREVLNAARQVSVRLLPDGRIEITSPEFAVQYIEPGGKNFGLSYDQFRAHGDGVMEVRGSCAPQNYSDGGQ
jgi:(p)ppGpp synthase/HD superfamily hydrolase